MMKAFVLAETADAAKELCAGARAKAQEVVLVAVATDSVLGVADRVVHIDVPTGAFADDAYATVNRLFDEETPELVLAQPTRRMKYLAGRLAAHAGTAVITDVIAFDDDGAETLYFGDIAHRMSKPTGSTAVYTVGSGVFDAEGALGTSVVEERAFVPPARAASCVEVKELPPASVDLPAADIIVAAGRGFGSEDELVLARDLAAKVGGEVGCTRPLAEGEAWMPREAYIGVSGVTASPNVYFGIGVSGQMQHMVGINRARTIVAVNKDKNAPLFAQADYGIVGDLKAVVPALIAAL